MKKKPVHKKTGLSEKIVAVLLGYAKTQLLLIGGVTLLTWIVLARVGVQFALLLALITGAVSIVPVIGITVAAVIASLVAVFDDIRFLPHAPVVVEGLAIIAVYGVLNFVIDYFISPFMVGKSIGIHPILLLALLILGTAFFGVAGAILTAPVVLVVKTIIEHYLVTTKRSSA